MIIEVKVPVVGESITSGFLAVWKVSNGGTIRKGEELFELETDKVTMSVTADTGGVVTHLVTAGAEVQIGQVVATIDSSATVGAVTPAGTPVIPPEPPPPQPTVMVPQTEGLELNPPAGLPQVAVRFGDPVKLSPSVRRLVEENQLDPSKIPASGDDDRLLKEDVLNYLANMQAFKQEAVSTIINSKPVIPVVPSLPVIPLNVTKPSVKKVDESGRTTRQPMTPLRARIAERLVSAQQNAAILTTFNEADMSGVLAIRSRYKETFKEKHDVGLGFMSFFVKAVIEALKTVPQVNAQIDGNDIVYHHYYDIGIAVSTDKGLVVPVIRDADKLSFADIEKQIADYAKSARERSITLPELQGGVFTISNGGIFGSLLSTPILNPPQSAILGLHTIQKRPVVRGDDDRIVVRPMMYLAMSYDHRLIDGRESVTFLKRIVECIEDPERLMLGI